jgi:tetrahydromethanopterin S-methyltransferase subunit B
VHQVGHYPESQGDTFSVIVFNLVVDYIIKKLDIRENISTKVVQINAYADDVVIISRNLKALEEALQELDNTAQKIGRTVSQEKTKYMRVSKRHTVSLSR